MRADRVAVRGTVTPEDATVQILGRSVQVGNGVFAGSVPLHRGANTIDVVASAAGSAPATATITVNRPGPRRARPKAKRIRAKGAPPLSGAIELRRGLTAGAHTSCPFAENVRAALRVLGQRQSSTSTAQRRARPIACTARAVRRMSVRVGTAHRSISRVADRLQATASAGAPETSSSARTRPAPLPRTCKPSTTEAVPAGSPSTAPSQTGRTTCTALRARRTLARAAITPRSTFP